MAKRGRAGEKAPGSNESQLSGDLAMAAKTGRVFLGRPLCPSAIGESLAGKKTASFPGPAIAPFGDRGESRREM
jgi:hypothetical protein